MCGRASELACTVDHEGVSGPERYLRHWHAVATTNACHVQRQNWLVPGKVVKLDPDYSCKEAVVRDAPAARLPRDLVAAHCRRRTLLPPWLVRVEHRAPSLHVYRRVPLYSLDRALLVPALTFPGDAPSIPCPSPRRSTTGSSLPSLHAVPTHFFAPDTSVSPVPFKLRQCRVTSSPAVSRSRHLTVCGGVCQGIRCSGYCNLTLETSSLPSQSSAVASPGPAECCARSTFSLCHAVIQGREWPRLSPLSCFPASSLKRTYSPSPFRALVSRRYSNKHHLSLANGNIIIPLMATQTLMGKAADWPG